MAKTKCQPCITISTIWKLAKIHFKHFIEDVRAFNTVQEYSCKIHYAEDISKIPLIPTKAAETIKNIRETAASKYNSEITEKIFAIPEDIQNKINEQILKETT
jgi:cell division ATPase FtsA